MRESLFVVLLAFICIFFMLSSAHDSDVNKIKVQQAFDDGRTSMSMEVIATNCDSMVKEGHWDKDSQETCDRFRNISKKYQEKYDGMSK